MMSVFPKHTVHKDGFVNFRIAKILIEKDLVNMEGVEILIHLNQIEGVPVT